MRCRILKRPQSFRDLDEIAAYLGEQVSLAAELRFLDAAEEAFRFLADFPKAGHVTQLSGSRLSGLRQWRIQGFESIQVFYRHTGEAIEVIRVVHGARDIPSLLEDTTA
jgi:toxin ParE1/3/4